MVTLLAMIRLEIGGRKRGNEESGVSIAKRLFDLDGNADQLFKAVWVFNQQNGLNG